VTPSAGAHDLLDDAGARAFLEAMVRLPSPSGSEGAVAEGFVAALAPHAEEAFVDEVGNAVAVAGRGALRVTLLGHLDTFPGMPPVHLRGRRPVRPRGGRRERSGGGAGGGPGAGGRRGAGGTRAPVHRRGRRGGCREPWSASRRAAYPRPHLLIVGEPSGWSGLTLGYKGHLRMQLRAARAAAHAARDEPTACEALISAWARLRTWATESAPTVVDEAAPRLFDRLQVALTSLGSSHDGLTERAEAVLIWRLPPAWPPSELRAALAELDLGPNLSWTADEGAAAVRAQRDGRLARAFRTAIRAAGGVPAPRVKTGSSDWNVVASAWDVDTIAYGPGDAALDHTPAEQLALDELDRSIAVLGSVLRQLARHHRSR
jgi:[amino group carrier protein]-lysine/ornithine hydrolase